MLLKPIDNLGRSTRGTSRLRIKCRVTKVINVSRLTISSVALPDPPDHQLRYCYVDIIYKSHDVTLGFFASNTRSCVRAIDPSGYVYVCNGGMFVHPVGYTVITMSSKPACLNNAFIYRGLKADTRG